MERKDGEKKWLSSFQLSCRIEKRNRGGSHTIALPSLKFRLPLWVPLFVDEFISE
ncbi:hypothetical protein [Peribacillus sp. Bi96]|uniref:hypothetical protein n=1 Tax=Peribacillus sp. Bi96 TaxID=2884273 RepID=UPI001E527925|nr:hypothetical protein [Peribacillus sp. Bi96]